MLTGILAVLNMRGGKDLCGLRRPGNEFFDAFKDSEAKRSGSRGVRGALRLTNPACNERGGSASRRRKREGGGETIPTHLKTIKQDNGRRVGQDYVNMS